MGVKKSDIKRGLLRGLSKLKIDFEPDVELVESDDEEDDREIESRVGSAAERVTPVAKMATPVMGRPHNTNKDEAIDVFTPLPTATRKNSFTEINSAPSSTR